MLRRPRHRRSCLAKKVQGLVYVLEEWCKGCGFCVEFCPFDIMTLDGKMNSKGYSPPILTDPERCTGCDLCGMVCPEFAIWVKKVPAAKMESRG